MHYYEKFPEEIKLKCGYGLDYIIKYVLCIKNEQLQLQISIICHLTRCLSIKLKLHTLIGLLLMCCGDYIVLII